MNKLKDVFKKKWFYAIGACRLLKNALRKEKRKTIDNTNISCLFVVQRTECFTSFASLYYEMSKDDRFKISLLVLPRYIQFPDGKEVFDFASISKNLFFCENLTGRHKIIASYDFEKGEFISLKDQKFDYVFINIPYTEQYPETLNIAQLNRIGRVCYLPYGYNSSKNKSIFKETNPWRSLSLFYRYYSINKVSNRELFWKRYIFLNLFARRKTLRCLGYPRFDLIKESEKKNKIDCVLWLPRYETKFEATHEKSSFMDYKDKIIDFAISNPEVKVIIRPHPLTFSNHISKGLLTQQDIDLFRDKINEIDNLFLDESSSYMEAICEANLILSDFTGMIVEFFLMGKKISFFGEKNSFHKKFYSMVDSFYDGNSWDAFFLCFEKLKNGEDSKQKLREKAMNDFWEFNVKNASRNIVNDLLRG